MPNRLKVGVPGGRADEADVATGDVAAEVTGTVDDAAGSEGNECARIPPRSTTVPPGSRREAPSA